MTICECFEVCGMVFVGRICLYYFNILYIVAAPRNFFFRGVNSGETRNLSWEQVKKIK